MSDYCETTEESWFDRITQGTQWFFVGLVLIPLSMWILKSNEFRAASEARGLTEGEGEVISVSPKTVRSENEGKLIYLNGEVGADARVYDPTLNFSVPGLRLNRHVEVYQWKENTWISRHKSFTGTTEKHTTYNYSAAWSDELIDATKFKLPEGHENFKSFPVENTDDHFVHSVAHELSPKYFPGEKTPLVAGRIAIGAFQIPAEFVTKIKGDEPLPFTWELLHQLPPNIQAKAQVDGDRLYLGENPQKPAIGDARVSFRVLPATTYSILGRQEGGWLAPFQTHSGTAIERMEMGTLDPKAIFQHAEHDNHLRLWGYRVGGWLLMAIGILFVLAPIEDVSSFSPSLAWIVDQGITMAALILSSAASVLVIGISRVVARL